MSQDAFTLLLAHHLKALKLPTFLRDYTSVAATCCKRRSKSAAGGARKVRHLPGRRERFLGWEVKSEEFAAR